MDFWYDGQIRRYLTQFIRAMSHFSCKDGRGEITRVPVIYGDPSRQVASIISKNSENTAPTVPIIACYIKDLQFNQSMMQDPTFVSKLNITERDIDPATGRYLTTKGRGYTIERLMPTPYKISFAADIWTSNLDQKLQLFEQITVLFTPSLEIQTTDNFVDWTSLSVLERAGEIWSSRSIPQGVDDNIDIFTMLFTAPVWISPPAKVKKLGIITKIISDIHAVSQGAITKDYSDPSVAHVFGKPDTTVVVTPGNLELLVLSGGAYILDNTNHNLNAEGIPASKLSWHTLLNRYPDKFIPGISQIRLTTPANTEIIATCSLDPSDDTKMLLTFDPDTVPQNTMISGRGTVNAVVDPATHNPTGVVAGTRYLLLNPLNPVPSPTLDGPDNWKNLDGTDPTAYENDIIEWDGSKWSVVFNAAASSGTVYVTNSYTGVQYKWTYNDWNKSYDGIYVNALWRMII